MKKAFHEYCRSEKFFSATLLSYLLINNNFEGLKRFLSYLNEKSFFPLYNNDIRKPIQEELLNSNNEIHYATEMNIIQDLSHNGYSINPNSLTKKIKGEAIPDVISVIGDVILIIEVKYYTNYYESKLNQQLAQQKYIFDVLKDFYGIEDMGELHICICPDKINLVNGYVITWEEIYKLFNETPNCNFVLESLQHNIYKSIN